MNQLCKVCGEPAAGFHFGAFTCEGCKVSVQKHPQHSSLWPSDPICINNKCPSLLSTCCFLMRPIAGNYGTVLLANSSHAEMNVCKLRFVSFVSTIYNLYHIITYYKICLLRFVFFLPGLRFNKYKLKHFVVAKIS